MPVPRLLALALLGLTLIVGACSSNGAASLAPTPTATLSVGVPSPSGAPVSASAGAVDRQFIDMMVPHHQSAIEMAKLAKDRASHAELKTLADQIIAAQEGEVSQLREWRVAWFGSAETPPMTAMPLMPGMTMPGMTMPSMSPTPTGGMSMAPGHGMAGDVETMDMTADVERLKSADPFDLAFIDAMIQHHAMAIDAARIAIAGGARAEIQALAREIIEAQQREIDQLAAWRQAWYPNG